MVLLTFSLFLCSLILTGLPTLPMDRAFMHSRRTADRDTGGSQIIQSREQAHSYLTLVLCVFFVGVIIVITDSEDFWCA